MAFIEKIKTYIPYAISAISLVISVITSYKTKQKESYLTIDAQYKDLLSKSLSIPYVRNPYFTCNYSSYKKVDPEKYYSYDSYAYMIWNFIETTYDLGNKRKKSYINNVWKPVALEENKLHLKWFLDHTSLFRNEFQSYVVDYLNELVLEDGSFDDFKEVYKLLYEEFPEAERKTKDHMVHLLLTGVYNLCVLRFKNRTDVDNSVIGYGLYYKNQENDKIFLDYLHIVADYQNCGYGSKFLELLKNRMHVSDSSGIFFEIEPPVDEKTERREKFYKKNGAIKLEFDYYLPTKEHFIPMDLMCIPCGNTKKISAKELQDFISQAVSNIHSDYLHTPKVIEEYLSTIPDFYVIRKDEIFLEKVQASDLSMIVSLMKKDFEADLQMDEYVLRNLLNSGNYVLYIIKDKDKDFIGYTFIYAPISEGKEKNLVLIDYLSIHETVLKESYVSIIISKLKSIYKDYKYGLMAEIPLASIRNSVYEYALSNADAKADFKYVYPSNEGMSDMQLVFCTQKGVEKIPAEDIIAMVDEYMPAIHGKSKYLLEALYLTKEAIKDVYIKK